MQRVVPDFLMLSDITVPDRSLRQSEWNPIILKKPIVLYFRYHWVSQYACRKVDSRIAAVLFSNADKRQRDEYKKRRFETSNLRWEFMNNTADALDFERTEAPPEMNVELRDYQQEALTWLIEREEKTVTYRRQGG